MTAGDDEAVSRPTAFRPLAVDISPTEFEQFVVELLGTATDKVEGLAVTLHDRVTGVDGTYDFDATVRFQLVGMAFLVVVEAKRLTHPIKRELVQVLHQKVQSVGAHKGVMFSTAPYQSGALDYAKVHGIALATVTEGRFTLETRGRDGGPALSREEALDHYGIPTFVAHAYSEGDEPGSTRVTLLSVEHPDYVTEEILGVAGVA